MLDIEFRDEGMKLHARFIETFTFLVKAFFQ